MFSGVDKIKWVLMGVSHSHDFSFFPPRVPNRPLPDDVAASIREMASRNIPCAVIKMQLDVRCPDDVFQNVLRATRRELKADKARALRDAAAVSPLWSSEVHLTPDSVFVEAFFVNALLVAKGVDTSFVFVDDTACTNMFHLPVMAVLCRDAADQTHALAWGLLKNRTTESFRRFFTFLFRHAPAIRTFMCDRHYAQRRAIEDVFGAGVSVFHCSIHVARNIRNNAGANSELASSFWAMRSKRTPEAEAVFLAALQRVHAAKRTLFTTQLLHHVDSFLPSRLDHVLRRSKFPALSSAKMPAFISFEHVDLKHQRAAAILQWLAQVGDVQTDVLSFDNTNTVEGYFSVVKRRIVGANTTLLDVFKAVDFTEATAMSRHNPSTPALPQKLVDCLTTVVAPDVLNVLNGVGVNGLIGLVVESVRGILEGTVFEDTGRRLVSDAITAGTPIDTYLWMPPQWIVPAGEPTTTHFVSTIDGDEGAVLKTSSRGSSRFCPSQTVRSMSLT